MDTLFTALRVAVSLGAVLAVIWYAHRRITRGAGLVKSERPITIIGRQGLSQKASVVIIEAEGKRLLLGVTEHTITVLSDSDLPVVSYDSTASYDSTSSYDSAATGEPTTAAVPVDGERRRELEGSARSFSRHLAETPPAEPAQALTRPRNRAAASPSVDAIIAANAPAITGAPTTFPAPHGLLRGSILSAETWKLSFAALRQGPQK
ncbi:MAG: hypothetical protein JWQ43_2284 [Glaciihabitans sp.]|nr:hypothetical protein [Glaciihabitans sp.]